MKQVSVVISAYNESNRLPQSLDKIALFKHAHPEIDLELVVVDDGSKDSTWEIIHASPIINKKERIIPNGGKGHGLRVATKLASYDLVYLCDADLSSPIDELVHFLSYSDEYDIIIGSRALDESEVKTSFIKKSLGRVGNFMIGLFLGLGIKDTQCGFKLLTKKSKELFLQTTIDRWGFDFELLYFVSHNNLRLKELPVTWVNTEDSRVTSLDYVRTFKDLLSIWWKYKFQVAVPKVG